ASSIFMLFSPLVSCDCDLYGSLVITKWLCKL
uniref:Uncharacterized protein n=1 Tax=Cebus imitator TaxID=2715852 RepID=A0A2K5S2M2_CEBIM